MATMLDAVLRKDPIVEAAPAAQGTGVAATPADLAPKAPASPVVAKALEMTRAVDQAAGSSPIMQKIDQQAALLEQDYATAMPKIAGINDQMAQVRAEPDPARPTIPRLKPLPAMPTIEEIAKERGVKPEDFNNPMRVFGQFMPVLISLGALAFQKNGIMAMNAATAAMNAVKAGDKEAYETAHKEWLSGTKLTVDENNQLLSEYNLILNDRNASMAEKQARLAGLAAEKQDVLGQVALRSGMIEQLVKLNEARGIAAGRIGDMVELTVRDQLGRDELALRERIAQWEQYRALNPAITSTDERIAQLAGIMANATPERPVTAAQMNALNLLLDMKDKERKGGAASAEDLATLVAVMAGTGVAPPTAAAAPGKNGAQAAAPPPAAAPAAAPAAGGTKEPPVSMLKEGGLTVFKNGQVWTLRGGKPVFVEQRKVAAQ